MIIHPANEEPMHARVAREEHTLFRGFDAVNKQQRSWVNASLILGMKMEKPKALWASAGKVASIRGPAERVHRLLKCVWMLLEHAP